MKKMTVFISALVLVWGGCFLGQAVAESGQWPTVQREITKKFKEDMDEIAKNETSTKAIGDARPFSIKYLLAGAERFELVDSAIITDKKGKVLSPDDLEVPCVAEIEYQKLSTGGKNVVSLKVVKSLTPSSPEWSPLLPD